MEPDISLILMLLLAFAAGFLSGMFYMSRGPKKTNGKTDRANSDSPPSFD